MQQTAKQFAAGLALMLGLVTAIANADNTSATSEALALEDTSSVLLGVESREYNGVLLPPQTLADDFSAYPDLDEAIAEAAEAGQELAEPVAIPEPPAFALLACLGILLLSMTLVRWHFDRATEAVPVKSPRTNA